MPDMTLAPRRRPLWRLFIMPVLLLVAAAAWSAFWFFAASQVEVRADAWRAQEAKSGRVYDCAKRSVAGFPFRLEVRCDGASVSLVSQTAGQAATQTPMTAQLGEILIVAQVYDPKLLIAEFTAPATIADRGQQPSMIVNWSKARSSVVGLPAIPQRASMDRRRRRLRAQNTSSCTAGLSKVRRSIVRRSKPCCGSRAAACRGCIRCSRRRSMPTCGRC